MTDGVGMPKRNVRGMIGAQTGATNRHASDQPKILIFVITGTRRGEKNKRQPALIAENKHFKLAAQIWRVPFDVTFVHRKQRDILVAHPQNRKPAACATSHLREASRFRCGKTRSLAI